MVVFGIAGLIIGVLLLAAGIFLIIGFPAAEEHQPTEFSLAGIVLGVIFLIIGAVLVFA